MTTLGPDDLPVYVRVGNGPQHLAGTIDLTAPDIAVEIRALFTAVADAVAEQLARLAPFEPVIRQVLADLADGSACCVACRARVLIAAHPIDGPAAYDPAPVDLYDRTGRTVLSGDRRTVLDEGQHVRADYTTQVRYRRHGHG